MYKVLIVDDEPWIIKDLKSLIDWETFGFRIVAEASSGEEAEKLIKVHNPDMIISDIRMPEMNGLELVQNIKTRRRDMIIVFISAYSDFTYAQEAINIGAFDYILKPVEVEKLKSTLRKVFLALEERTTINNSIKNYNNTRLLTEIIDMKASHSKIRVRLSEYGFCQEYDNFRIIIVKAESTFISIGIDIISQDIFSNLMKVKYISALMGVNKWIYLINYSSMNKEDTIKFYKKVLSIVKLYKLDIGVSKSFESLEEVRSFFLQADLMVENRIVTGRHGMYFYRKEKAYSINNICNSMLKTSNQAELRDAIKQIPVKCKKLRLNIEEIIKIYNQAVLCVARSNAVNMEMEILDKKEFAYRFSSMEDIVKTLLEGFETYSDSDVGKLVSNNIVRKVIDEINNSFNKKIMISDLAEKFHINSNYLSGLFKNYTGKSFTNYLVEVRINKAAELLDDGELTLYEISEKVGYEDYFHFSKIFKKYKNVSPNVYRKDIRRRTV